MTVSQPERCTTPKPRGDARFDQSRGQWICPERAEHHCFICLDAVCKGHADSVLTSDGWVVLCRTNSCRYALAVGEQVRLGNVSIEAYS